ncbi:RING finger protein 10 [Trichoplusia ni]|uniref:E3 ubiquitin-protein ligase RNF10 n=1 Tax=Trichoplusia ni TaxID=7111 RepID=A0A7E5V8P1_TRINI|nr:RING finger protein 10 [Trichoplusia ni]
MLEESKMDKKSLNRSSQPQSRASAIDCKKNTELTNKPWPRNNKKREGPGSAPKNETSRKNVPSQRGKGQFDRRPRPRGSGTYAMGGTPNTRVEEDDEPEIGSVFVPGSKKHNLNHLLNFMYPSRGVLERRGPQPRRQGQQYRGPCRHDHDLYLRAYCQFVVKEDGDYKANLLDPDIPMKWDQIEEIVVRGTGRSECPICLGPPAAGRVGLCGHVYCWACVLHYAAAHDKQPPPCPVCTTPLHVKDMKPTRMVQWGSPTEEVTMRLVRRLRGSTTVEEAPIRGLVTEAAPSIMPLEKISNAPYCKLFSATKDQIHEILKRERTEIEQQILAEIDTTEIVFLEQALEMLKLKENNINVKNNEPKFLEDKNEDIAPTVYQKQEINQNKLDWFDVNEEGAAAIETIQNDMDELDLDAVDSNLNPEAPSFELDEVQPEEFPLTEYLPQEPEQIDNAVTDIDKLNQSKYFYFYQAEDGQQVFLNSLNVRILNASWGALAAAPQVIHGRVLHRETFSLSEQTRKHMPCTAHLPLYCAYDVVELDLQPPYVSTAALQSFTDELDRRARIRARHERDERRRERAYRRTMEGPPKPDVFSEVLFPPAPPSFSSPPLEPGPLAAFEQASPSTSVGSPPPGPSFAKMASTSGTWRVRHKAAETTPLPAPDAEAGAPRALVLSDAIEAALHAASAPSAKKNKKSKQKVLFATGMQRAA